MHTATKGRTHDRTRPRRRHIQNALASTGPSTQEARQRTFRKPGTSGPGGSCLDEHDTEAQVVKPLLRQRRCCLPRGADEGANHLIPDFGRPHDDRISTVKQQIEVGRLIETHHGQHGPRPGPKPEGTSCVAVVEVEHARSRVGEASPLSDLNVRYFRLKAWHHRDPSHRALPKAHRTHRSNSECDTKSDQGTS